MKMGVSRVALADFFEHLHAALVRHHQIEQDQVVGVSLPAACRPSVPLCGQFDAIAFAGEQRFQAFADIGFVVDDQDLAFDCPGSDLGSGHLCGIHRLPCRAGHGQRKFQHGNRRRRRAGWRLRSPPCSRTIP